MARAKQKNLYMATLSNGIEVTVTASKMSEAQNIIRRLEGGQPATVQRIFKNSTRVCHNVKGKTHSV